MADRQPLQHRRRVTTQKVNYNEKEADAELMKRIQNNEKSSSKNKTKKGDSNKNKVSKIGNGGNTKNNDRSPIDKKKFSKFLSDKNKYWNFIPSLPPSSRKNSRFSHIIDLEDALVDVKKQILYNKEGTLLKRNEMIYMVSEPPGEPYYIGRIMEFLSKPEFKKNIDNVLDSSDVFPAEYFLIRMNWFYRPRDIQENANNADPRLVYASLHQDICPINSFRGKCSVVHKSDINNKEGELDTALTRPNVFYFEQLFDRYTSKYYIIWDVEKLLKEYTDTSYLHALSKRFKYVYTEEKYPFEEVIYKYVSSQKSTEKKPNIHDRWDDRCVQCRQWTTYTQSMKCDECGIAIHLFCMDPPRDRKPNKGIIWLCYTCANIQDNINGAKQEKEEEIMQELQYINEEKSKLNEISLKLLKEGLDYNQQNIWFQYIGEDVINHLEDALCSSLYLPYPFKCSRTGPKYQWSQCIDTAKWKPNPYVSEEGLYERGVDDSSSLLSKIDFTKISNENLDLYVRRCKETFPGILNMLPESVNFLDMIMAILLENDYNTEKSYSVCESSLTRESLKEPTFSSEDVKKFENAVREHGSELFPVCKEVGTQPMSMIVRFYYCWKKTSSGRDIWGNFKGRAKNKVKYKSPDSTFSKKEKESNSEDSKKNTRTRKPSRIVLENQKNNKNIENVVELRYIDDSSIETEDAQSLKSHFQCMFCSVDYSPMWYKITGGSDDENINTRMQTGVNEKTESSNKVSVKSKNIKSNGDRLDALCIRCARLWRRYAVRWVNPVNILKTLHGSSNSNMQNTLERIFTESNVNLFMTLTSQARNKNIEWELVQDAELITRQRKELLKDDDRIQRIKRNAVTTHSQLYKLVKRPYDKSLFDHNIMQSNLEEYIENLVKEKVEEEVVNLKTPLENKKYTESPSKVQKRKIGSTDSKGSQNEKPNKINKITGISNISSEKLKLLYKLNNIYQDKITTSGTLEIPLSTKELSNAKIAIDPEYEYIHLDDILYQKFNSLTNYNVKAEQFSKLSNKLVKNDIESILKEEEKGNILHIFDEANVPVIQTCLDPSSMLGSYHQFNPSVITRRHNIYLETMKSENESNNQSSNQSSQQVKNTVENSNPKECNVCSNFLDADSQGFLECSNCSLTIHPSCYGAQTPDNVALNQKLNDFKWLCDPCSNDLNPIISTSYRCCVCYSKGASSENQKGANEINTQQALKATTNGTWCHVICAIFNIELKFGNVTSLQPIAKCASVVKFCDDVCNECNMMGGSMNRCEFCSTQVHTSCAQWSKNYNLMFRKQTVDNYKTSEKPVITDNSKNESFILHPIIICSTHDYQNDKAFVSLADKFNDGECTILEIYIKTYKSISEHSIIYTRYLDQCKLFNNGSPETDILVKNLTPAKAIDSESKYYQNTQKLHMCSKCHSAKSLYWFDNDVCHSCHTSNGIIRDSIKENNLLLERHNDSMKLDTMLPIELKFLLSKEIEYKLLGIHTTVKPGNRVSDVSQSSVNIEDNGY